MDFLDAGAQPHCCGVVMRTERGRDVCPVCRKAAAHDEAVAPPAFDGPTIRGG